MAVFTEVSFATARDLMHHLQLGELKELRGIQGGIENTNYFVTTEVKAENALAPQQGDYVLTLFERLTAEQLPFYLQLMKHLANKGIPVPNPKEDSKNNVLHHVCQKPAAVVHKLQGKSELNPTKEHCKAVGEMLAKMHLAGQDFELSQPNLRGLSWWNETVPAVLPHLDAAQKNTLQAELAYQNHIALQPAYAALPRGPIHADLFRDNVMFDGLQLTGFFDFYFAGIDTWLFDLAVCLNDWCIDLSTGSNATERSHAFIAAYTAIRPLQAAERRLFSAMVRAAALRFWISRLWDFYLPREAALLQPHDPTHFERILRQRIASPIQLDASF